MNKTPEPETIDLHPDAALPSGWRWGAHWSAHGQSGYWLLGPLDITVRARLTPDGYLSLAEALDAEDGES